MIHVRYPIDPVRSPNFGRFRATKRPEKQTLNFRIKIKFSNKI